MKPARRGRRFRTIPVVGSRRRGIGNPGERARATAAGWALAIVLGFVGAAGAADPAIAEAGIKGKAKQATKKKIKKRDGQPVKISCRQTKKKGVICKWTYAELVGSGSVRNCKGSSKLKKKRSKLKFKRSRCKADRGAGAVMSNLPNKLLDEGYESTFVFCFTTLGNGYRCKWDALQFKPASIERCSGTATSKKRNVKIKLSRCSRDAVLTAAQGTVRNALAGRGLNPGQIDCRPGSPVKCDWVATTSSAGWEYSCTGTASGSDIGACNLQAPEEAPLTDALGGHPTLGFNDDWNSLSGQLPDVRSDFDSDTARFSIAWSSVDRGPTAGNDWSVYDATYNAILAQGMKPTLILTGAPCRFVDSGEPCSAGETNHPPSVDSLQAWAGFVAEAAARYPQALAFEVWNEANFDLFFYGAPKPARYAKILETSYDAIKSVDPSMPVVTTGLAPFASSGSGFQRYDDFLRDIYAQGIKGHYDAIGHHGYSGRAFNEDYEQSIRIQIADLKDVMLDYGEQDEDIWITETGLSNTAEKPYDESQQATALVKLYKQYRRIPGIPVVIIHRWRDDASAKGELSAERGYGMQRSNGSRKPVYCDLSDARGAVNPSNC